MSSRVAWNALIRTHHITSRKKVSKLKQAAAQHGVYVLLRSGGSPGIMYVEGASCGGVEAWVSAVQRLRYKDYHLAARPSQLVAEGSDDAEDDDGREGPRTGLFEVDTVKAFGEGMRERGVLAWWREAMGYTGQDERL